MSLDVRPLHGRTALGGHRGRPTPLDRSRPPRRREPGCADHALVPRATTTTATCTRPVARPPGPQDPLQQGLPEQDRDRRKAGDRRRRPALRPSARHRRKLLDLVERVPQRPAGPTRLWDVHSGRQTGVLAGHTDYALGVAVPPTAPSSLRPASTSPWRCGTSRARRSRLARSPRCGWPSTAPTGPAGHRRHRPHRAAVGRGPAPAGGDLARPHRNGLLGGLRARRPHPRLRRQRPHGPALGHRGRPPAGRVDRPQNYANDVTFSPDGRLLASAGDDLTVRLWNVTTHRRLATLTDHTGAVRSVTFAPGGRTLASSGNDCTVRLWDVRRHHTEATLTGDVGSVRGVAFSATAAPSPATAPSAP